MEERPARRSSSPIRRVLLAVLLAACTLGGAELAARCWYAWTTGDTGYLSFPRGGPLALQRTALSSKADDSHGALSAGRGGGLAPGEHEVWAGDRFMHSVPINASGFRGRDLGEGGPDSVDIVTLGGSSVFSGDCPEGQSWPELLEERLAARNGAGRFAVVNRGMNGWSTREAVDHLEELADLPAARRPAAALLYSAFNAIEDTAITVDLRQGLAPWHTRLLYGRSLYYTVSFHSWLVARQREAGLRSDGTRDPEVVARAYAEDLRRFVSASRAAGIAPVLVHQALATADEQDLGRMGDRIDAHTRERWPHMRAAFSAKEPAHARLQEVLAEVAAAEGVPRLDPRAALLARPEEHFMLVLHLTPEGARVLAEELDAGLAALPGGLPGLIAAR